MQFQRHTLVEAFVLVHSHNGLGADNWAGAEQRARFCSYWLKITYFEKSWQCWHKSFSQVVWGEVKTRTWQNQALLAFSNSQKSGISVEGDKEINIIQENVFSRLKIIPRLKFCVQNTNVLKYPTYFIVCINFLS